ncbi:MAG: hypothetical protein HQ521_15755 [Bacteroidetes bacterium]|nr:hypothetical protein [Bacteroidota bacterium]
MEKREDFWDIFDRTLKMIKNQPVLANLIFNNGEKYQILIAQSYINFISSPFISAGSLENLKNEYSNNKIGWLTPLQSLYVLLSTTQLFRFIFIRRLFLINSRLKKNVFIIPGNHRLRFINAKNKNIYVVLKCEENSNFIENEIKIRNQFNLSYTPKFLSFGINWFEEEYFSGTPINRIANTKKTINIKTDLMIKHNKQIIIPSLSYIGCPEYISRAIYQIEQLIDRLTKQNQNKIKDYCPLRTLRLIHNNHPYINNNIPISTTHGDFQVSNILVGEKATKIIDWENTTTRFSFYDEFVLYSGIRQTPDYNIRTLLDIYYYNFIVNKKSDLIKSIDLANFPRGLFYLSIIVEETLFITNDQLSKNYMLDSNKPNILSDYLLSIDS